eukprot:CAMPEP_0206612610 /NCGR_PEP_ID=MMETSP0325_2-20121206/56105_1 /ASSEMBLY_ACC=CAM_ASM_000347 /TAXON_ID=2866 /ORGANISM="Crypthecodinium cohnii, Strain Seligo" /LENGTH=425 /DNA_ID=CAMNT_0054132361 /DNA_START=214 /DNA_END=1489 /DNA_ORIENTATION=-
MGSLRFIRPHSFRGLSTFRHAGRHALRDGGVEAAQEPAKVSPNIDNNNYELEAEHSITAYELLLFYSRLPTLMPGFDAAAATVDDVSRAVLQPLLSETLAIRALHVRVALAGLVDIHGAELAQSAPSAHRLTLLQDESLYCLLPMPKFLQCDLLEVIIGTEEEGVVGTLQLTWNQLWMTHLTKKGLSGRLEDSFGSETDVEVEVEPVWLGLSSSGVCQDSCEEDFTLHAAGRTVGQSYAALVGGLQDRPPTAELLFREDVSDLPFDMLVAAVLADALVQATVDDVKYLLRTEEGRQNLLDLARVVPTRDAYRIQPFCEVRQSRLQSQGGAAAPVGQPEVVLVVVVDDALLALEEPRIIEALASCSRSQEAPALRLVFTTWHANQAVSRLTEEGNGDGTFPSVAATLAQALSSLGNQGRYMSSNVR